MYDNSTHTTMRVCMCVHTCMYAKQNKLLLVDHYPNWKKYLQNEGKEGYLKIVTDGVHPNLEGYRKVLLPEFNKVFK